MGVGGGQCEPYRIKWDLSGKLQGECDAVKDKYGKRIRIEDKELRRWEERLREVLNRQDPTELTCTALGRQFDCFPQAKPEILKVIRSLKSNKVCHPLCHRLVIRPIP